MLVRRRPQTLVILVALVVVAGCGGTSVGPTAAPSTPAVATAAPTSTSPAASPTPSTSDAPSLQGQIVFEDSGQDFQHSQIWLENADGSNVRQVVSDDFTDNSASLSPDGTKIVFYRALTDSLEAAIADPSLFGRSRS